MNQNNEFSFFTKRITEPNLETDYFQLRVDKNFVNDLSEEEHKRDAILLSFEQRVWEYDLNQDLDTIQIFHSFYDNTDTSSPYFMHDIYYRDASKSELKNAISCVPTLSFRTLVINQNIHIKFGLPLYFGKMIRLYPIVEAMTSMYISDCIRGLPKSEILDFFQESKCYYYNDHADFSVSHRYKSNEIQAMPLGNYFNKILYFSGKDGEQAFSQALEFVKTFLLDYNLIVKYLSELGLGLEIHGQNLLVYIDNSGNSIRRYLYRDFGHCSISDDLYHTNKPIDKYYKERYDFNFESTNQISAFNVSAWQNIRIFILGFLFYNLNLYQKKYALNFDVYRWGGDIIKQCEYIADIY